MQHLYSIDRIQRIRDGKVTSDEITLTQRVNAAYAYHSETLSIPYEELPEVIALLQSRLETRDEIVMTT